MKIFLITLLLTSCANTIEVLEGLCYSDKDGTYICIEKEPSPNDKKWDNCRPWLNVDGEVWSNCMVLA